MKSLVDSLIRENPMKIEIQRFRRRFLGFGGTGFNNVVLALVLLCYTGLVMLVVNVRGDLPPIYLVIFQTGLFCFFGPAMLHGAIAGERERRSWDLLLVAPITKAQIVVGKFMGALAALAIGAVAMALPTILAAVSYGKTTLVDLLLAEGVSLSFCILVCAWTLFISARVKRPFMALGGSIGMLLLALVVFPALFASVAGSDRFTSDLMLYLHPFAALSILAEDGSNRNAERMIPTFLYGIPHILLYLALSIGFLVYAEKTLNFAENEVKFLPRGHHDA